jgi:hypothetical protein
MHIDVQTPLRAFDDQTRAYAEFRVFSALARFSGDVGDVRVSLTQPPAGAHPVVCRVDVPLSCGTRVRASARGRHACDAIDRAAARISDALRRRARVAVTS